MDTEVDALVRVVEARAASESALDRLQAAIALVDERRRQDEIILDRFVATARRAGCSWSEIGATMGVSKQAAHQRFPTPKGLVETFILPRRRTRYLPSSSI